MTDRVYYMLQYTRDTHPPGFFTWTPGCEFTERRAAIRTMRIYNRHERQIGSHERAYVEIYREEED